jgi:putative membrane protein
MMDKDLFNPYAKFSNRSLTLNDYLAIDRTILSNERTLLAYGRTALAMVIIGGSALKFFDPGILTVVGWLFLVGGVIIMLIGWRRYRHTDRLLHAALMSQTGEGEHPLEEKLAEAEQKEKEKAKEEKEKAKEEKEKAKEAKTTAKQESSADSQ